jgi:hypothetical protein
MNNETKTESINYGTVIKWDNERSFGFIRPVLHAKAKREPDLFTSSRFLVDQPWLAVNDVVQFDYATDTKSGRFFASNVRVIRRAAPPKLTGLGTPPNAGLGGSLGRTLSSLVKNAALVALREPVTAPNEDDDRGNR